MRKPLIAIGLLFLLSRVLISCSQVPVTGRSQMNLIDPERMKATSTQQYEEFLENHKVVKSTEKARQLKDIGQSIAKGTEQYLRNNGYGERVASFDWEFNLVKDSSANAFCMAGGKVVFYSGILPICKDEKGIAVVMAHEIAHAVARHGNERMSQMLAARLGGIALETALAEKPRHTRNLWMRAYGLGTQVGFLLPYSRTHEAEADQMGLYFMAISGYNPRAAVNFWQRMKDKKGKNPPEFLSTHPNHDTRISEIKAHLDEAQKFYDKQGKS